jgi:hypothetical protein
MDQSFWILTFVSIMHFDIEQGGFVLLLTFAFLTVSVFWLFE